tara:strand:+ start:792 stop:914 length:123 start_codon:yes stop_codon:yes gene_type:complete
MLEGAFTNLELILLKDKLQYIEDKLKELEEERKKEKPKEE